MGKKNASVKIVCENRKARHDYFIHETYEAGIVLVGTEVKSLRAGKANLKDSFAKIKNNEIFLDNMHISPYEQGNIFNHDPLRARKLLMHKREILKLKDKIEKEGYTLIPLKMYFKGSILKVLIGLAKGKKSYDKREAIKKRDTEREMQKIIKYR